MFNQVPLVLPAAVFTLVSQIGGALVGPSDWITHAERLTLDVVLIVGLRELWSSNKKKDGQLLAISTKVTETMALLQESVKLLQKTTEELGDALDNLSSNIAVLPCTASERLGGQEPGLGPPTNTKPR